MKTQSHISMLMVGIFLLLSGSAVWADVVIYPGDANIFNVQNYGAAPNDGIDDTQAIRDAINAILAEKRVRQFPTQAGHHTLYFPAGTYNVSGSLTFGAERKTTPGGGLSPLAMKIHIKGQSRTGTIIRLANGTFTDAANPRPVVSLFDGPSENECFGNTVEDLTINVGSNNAGAIGLRYHNNNYGYVRRVTLMSGDGQGRYGLQLGSNLAGIGTVKDVEVRGFDYGIVNNGGFKITYVLEYITLSGQNLAGILSASKGLTVRRLTSTNTVPALIHDENLPAAEEDNGQVVIVGSTLQGGAPNQPAINNINGWILARGLKTSGYGATLRDHGTDFNFGFTEEYVTGGVFRLWDDAPERTLNLPIEETPEVPQDPQSDWAVVDAAAQADDTAAIQAAIDSGKTTVFLKRGSYTISNTIRLRGNLRRFNGNWSAISLTEEFALNSDKPVFQFENGTQDVVVFEAIDKQPFGFPKGGQGQLGTIWFMQNNASRTLVMRDLQSPCGVAYRNEGTGRLFIEGIFSTATAEPNAMFNKAGWVFNNQEVWARHINHEGTWPHFVNDGGKLWVLGFKTGEGHGPFFRTINSGQTEALGGIFNNLASASSYPPGRGAIEIVDSDVSISAIETSNSGGTQQPHPIMVKETRLDDTRELAGAVLPKRKSSSLNASVLPLYRSINPIAQVAPATVTVTRSGFRFVNTTGRFIQTVTVTNTGSTTVGGPFYLVLDNLSTNATLYNKTGETQYALPAGSPYIDIGAGGDGLSPNEARSVTLEFTKTGQASITYTTRVLAGSGSSFVFHSPATINPTLVGFKCLPMAGDRNIGCA